MISCRVAAAPRSAASVRADRANAVFRLVLQPLCTGEWDLVCAHCPGADFVGRIAGAESSAHDLTKSHQFSNNSVGHFNGADEYQHIKHQLANVVPDDRCRGKAFRYDGRAGREL